MKHVLALLMFISCSAFAAGSDNGSQYQWQTAADKWEVTPFLGYHSLTSTPKGTGGDTKTSGLRISVLGEYGISEMFSAGLRLSTLDDKVDNPGAAVDTKVSGMEDLMAFFHGRMPAGAGSFRYGLDVGFALAKNEKKTGGDTTASSGGMSLAPFVGYEMTDAACTYGARLSYRMYMGERTTKNVAPTAEDKTTGPTTTSVALFLEHDMAPIKLGAALEIDGTSASEVKRSSVTTSKPSGSTQTGLKIYVPYEVASNITILPELKYSKFTSVPGGIDSISQFDLNVGARFAF